MVQQNVQVGAHVAYREPKFDVLSGIQLVAPNQHCEQCTRPAQRYSAHTVPG